MEIVKESFIYKLLMRFISWVEAQIKNSGLYSIFTKDVKRNSYKGFFENILYKIIGILRTIFKKIKLDKIFTDSIFAKPQIWITLTIAFAPLLETMQILLFVLMTIVSFILKVMLEDDFKFKYTPMNAYVIIFSLIYLISAFMSLDKKSSLMIALLVISFILFYFVIINSIKSKKELNIMLGTFVIIGLLISLYGIYQYLFGGSFASSSYVDKEMFEDIQTRVSGTFDNPNVMGEYLLLVIPIALIYLFNLKGIFKKIISLGIIRNNGYKLSFNIFKRLLFRTNCMCSEYFFYF